MAKKNCKIKILILSLNIDTHIVCISPLAIIYVEPDRDDQHLSLALYESFKGGFLTSGAY